MAEIGEIGEIVEIGSFICRFRWCKKPLLCRSYRVSSKGVYAFVFRISRLLRGLEIPSWAIFNSPFCVDFENIQVFIIWLNLERDIGKILQGGDFKS